MIACDLFRQSTGSRSEIHGIKTHKSLSFHAEQSQLSYVLCINVCCSGKSALVGELARLAQQHLVTVNLSAETGEACTVAA